MSETAVLRARGLSFGYRREAGLFDDLEVTLEPGSVTALTGRSGRGKSTLLYLLAGLLTPWAGTVETFGQVQGRLSDAQRCALRAARFGFVFQDVVLDPRRPIIDSVLEPCLYAGLKPAEHEQRALDLLTSLGVQLQAGSRPGEISGGQAQRVGVCRALLLRPGIVFADEPTGNLDGESGRIVLDALVDAAGQGCAVVIATHDPVVVARCTDRIEL